MEGYLRREDTNAAILGLAKDGILIKEIVRRTVHSRNLVGMVLRGQRSGVFRVWESSLKLYQLDRIRPSCQLGPRDGNIRDPPKATCSGMTTIGPSEAIPKISEV